MSSPKLKIGSVNSDQTFETYEVRDEANRELVEGLVSLSKALATAADAICTYERPFGSPRGLLISGQPGRGKTHLVNAVVNRLISERPELTPHIAITSDAVGYTSDRLSSKRQNW